MDAKPQRPRALRVHDENMAPTIGIMPAKTLHQRTKSTPALPTLLQAGAIKAANKKVLGEINANIKVAQAAAKDDSEIGKASPGKISIPEPVKPAAAAAAAAAAATFARPPTRPLAPKSSAQNLSKPAASAVIKPSIATQIAQMTVAAPDPVMRVIDKKSMKVLKEEPPIARQQCEIQRPVANSHVHQALFAVNQSIPVLTQPQPVLAAIPVQRQEVHKTESIPLKDEPAAGAQLRPIGGAVNLPPGFTSEQEYMNLINYHTAQYQMQQQAQHMGGLPAISGAIPYLASNQLPTPEQYYDVEEEFEYDEGYTTARSFGLRGESTGGVTTVLVPKVTDRVKEELEAAKAFVEAHRAPEELEDEEWDTSMVAEYSDEIFDYMRDLENRMAPNPRYMDQQTEIQWSMRAVLMDWVVQVHQRFNLLPETLFLTANYIDRFLSCKIVSLGKLQLVGATAIFVASKYEEVQCPTISEIIYMVDGGYTPDELLKAERFMLSMLHFELGWPGPMSFLRRISKADDYDLETRTLAKYFLEVTIMDERFVGCTPSFLAAGAHCMARLFIHGAEWSRAHVYYSHYTWSQLRTLLGAMLECCEEPRKHHAAVFDKYTDKRYKRASIYVAEQLASGFRLPDVNPVAPPTPLADLLR